MVAKPFLSVEKCSSKPSREDPYSLCALNALARCGVDISAPPWLPMLCVRESLACVMPLLAWFCPEANNQVWAQAMPDNVPADTQFASNLPNAVTLAV